MSQFKISFVVDASELGDVLAKIHGQAKELDVGLVESVPHNKNKKRDTVMPKVSKKGTSRKGTRRGAAQEVILKALASAPNHTLSATDGYKILDKAGFAGDAIYNMRTSLAKRGLIEINDKLMKLVK